MQHNIIKQKKKHAHCVDSCFFVVVNFVVFVLIYYLCNYHHTDTRKKNLRTIYNFKSILEKYLILHVFKIEHK
jgi:hypothetical protein